MGPLTPTSKGAWQIAHDRWRDMDRQVEKLSAALSEAEASRARAQYDLNAHEACPGVPRWQHLQTAPTAEECTLQNGCREHGRYLSALPYATPYEDDPADDPADEAPF